MPKKTTTTKKTPPKTTTKSSRKHLERKEITRQFWIQLTPEQKDEFSTKAGRIYADIAKDEDKFSSVKKDWSAKITEKKTELDGVMKAIYAGKEYKVMDCTEVKDFKKETVTYFDAKKPKVILEERPFNEQEKQMAMPFGDKKQVPPGLKNIQDDLEKASPTVVEKTDEEKVAEFDAAKGKPGNGVDQAVVQ